MLKPITSLALLASLSVADATPTLPPPPFAGALDAQLARTQNGNFVVSPASIALGLAMAREGARGATADELDHVLGADAGANGKLLLRQLAASKDPAAPTLVIANQLFGDRGTAFEQGFLDVLSKDYAAPLASVDFRTKWDEARQQINKWVAETTHDKIKDLLSAGTVTRATRLVLVDAVYLKAAWASPFKPNATGPAAFAVDGGSSEQVPTMHGRTGAAQWGSYDGARMIELPYQSGGSQLSMLVLVPDGSSLKAIEASYAKEGISSFVGALTQSGPADVAMPKFEVGTKLELGPTLEAMGMKLAFSRAADFSGMSAKERLQISNVIHQAWIKVDEAGTEAAAATAVTVVGASVAMPVKPAYAFAVDRSFLFFVHDAQGNVLFGGRVIDPTAH